MIRVFLILTYMLVALPAQAAERYEIDNEQTHIKFAAKMCEADLLMGQFHKVEGSFLLDEEYPEHSSVSLLIHPESATFSKEYHREDHIDTIVKSEKFLHIAKFPEIHFESTSVKQTSDITADVTGNLTLAGVTHPMTLEVTFHKDDGHTRAGRTLAAFSAYGTFKRSNHGIMYALDRIGIRRIGDEVTVLVSVVGNKE